MTRPGVRRARSDALHLRVRQLVAATATDAPPVPERAFVRLALDIARFQADHVDAHARLWTAARRRPAAARTLAAIPALPCDLFRVRRMAAHPAREDERCFLTSGTSRGAASRGAHPLRTTATYAFVARQWGRQMLWPDRARLGFIGLVPTETDAPESSLVFMLARFAEALDPTPSWHVRAGRLDVAGVVEACAEARRARRPVLVAGTSLAFAELGRELAPGSLALSRPSRVLHTGGFKGQHGIAVEPGRLRAQIAALFDLPASHVVGEYGMTELSSQLYEGSLRRALGLGCDRAEPGCYYPPPWLRLRALDPESLRPVAPGDVGLAELLDLANVDSALRLLTADLVRLRPDGSAELVGRQPAASARGCSLGLEPSAGRRAHDAQASELDGPAVVAGRK